MPTKLFFDLLKESDQDFVARTGWEYRHDAQLYIPTSGMFLETIGPGKATFHCKLIKKLIML